MLWFLKVRMKYLYDNEIFVENFLYLKVCIYMYVIFGFIMKDLNLISVYIFVYGGFLDLLEWNKVVSLFILSDC